MSKYKVLPDQNLVDVALQEYGSITNLIDLCADNDLAIDSDLTVGQELIINDSLVTRNVADFFSLNEITIATEQNNI